MQKASGNQVNEVWRFEEESVVDVFEVSGVFKSSHNDSMSNRESKVGGLQFAVMDRLPEETLKVNDDGSNEEDAEDLVPEEHNR
jgi:hypothetical protein